jgi:dTDP-4-dehydrorhamnose 3,5-epimerase
MKLIEKKLSGVFEIQLNPHVDTRGFFMRTFDDSVFREFNLERKWVQENHSRSTQKGIIRGLHFQLPPYTETKLIRAIRGEVMDVFVDLREGSSTFGQWDSILLSENKFNCAFIPRGFAHGFCTLSDISEVVYKVDNYYSPENECGLLWNDPDIDIEWPLKNIFVSEKDNKNYMIKDFIKKFGAIKL